MKELVIFDIDNTIVNGQSQALFLNYLYKNGYVSIYYYVRLFMWVVLYKLGLVSNPIKPMKYGLSFIQGRTVEEAELITNDFFEKVLKHKIYKDAVEIIQDHKNKNRNIILVSNSPDVVVRKISDYLSLSDFLCTRLEVVDKKYTGNIFGEIMYGEQKLISVKKYLDSKGYLLVNSWAYGDHDSDVHLLSAVQHPFAVNPTKGLMKIAKNRNWPILYFKS